MLKTPRVHASIWSRTPFQNAVFKLSLKKDTKVRRADEVNGPYTRVETENDVICYVQEHDLAIYDTIDAYLRLFKMGGSAAVLKRVFAFFKNDEDREREVERLEAAGWSVKRNEPFEFEPPKTPHS